MAIDRPACAGESLMLNNSRLLVGAALMACMGVITACASGQPTDSIAAAYSAATSQDPSAQRAPSRSPNGVNPVGTRTPSRVE